MATLRTCSTAISARKNAQPYSTIRGEIGSESAQSKAPHLGMLRRDVRHDDFSAQEVHMLQRVYRVTKEWTKVEAFIIAARMSTDHQSVKKILSWAEDEHKFWHREVLYRAREKIVPDYTVMRLASSKAFETTRANIEHLTASIKDNDLLDEMLRELIQLGPYGEQERRYAQEYEKAHPEEAVVDPDLRELEERARAREELEGKSTARDIEAAVTTRPPPPVPPHMVTEEERSSILAHFSFPGRKHGEFVRSEPLPTSFPESSLRSTFVLSADSSQLLYSSRLSRSSLIYTVQSLAKLKEELRTSSSRRSPQPYSISSDDERHLYDNVPSNKLTMPPKSVRLYGNHQFQDCYVPRPRDPALTGVCYAHRPDIHQDDAAATLPSSTPFTQFPAMSTHRRIPALQVHLHPRTFLDDNPCTPFSVRYSTHFARAAITHYPQHTKKAQKKQKPDAVDTSSLFVCYHGYRENQTQMKGGENMALQTPARASCRRSGEVTYTCFVYARGTRAMYSVQWSMEDDTAVTGGGDVTRARDGGAEQDEKAEARGWAYPLESGEVERHRVSCHAGWRAKWRDQRVRLLLELLEPPVLTLALHIVFLTRFPLSPPTPAPAPSNSASASLNSPTILPMIALYCPALCSSAISRSSLPAAAAAATIEADGRTASPSSSSAPLGPSARGMFAISASWRKLTSWRCGSRQRFSIGRCART
ncbi:hypothetical protein K488DRAFT_75092 [Vararia minispora EC-137]|uniref:Uncharacterized protein n=1 Tax=Vararia minispora EC-137 TaxID=1314806 RepID=A0ACB8Q4U5_9AGAM|nr:hypothetical protein K488DRAFT_75092 [Vararia minispora EC-137]